MSLIPCPKCNRDITETSERCPYCGYQLKGIIIDGEDENEANYLIIGSRIVLALIVLVVIVFGIDNLRKSPRYVHKSDVVLKRTDSIKIKLQDPDSLLIEARVLYKQGKYNNADVILTRIINNYKNSDAAVEAAKLKIIVVDHIRKQWSEESKRAKNRQQQKLEQLYSEDLIKYYKTVYGPPDSESDFESGSYISKTLIWFCALEKYRSIDFVYKYGRWSEESKYTSECK